LETQALKEKILLLPDEPGVYRFIDREHSIIYVGKAKNLKNRVNSYFTGSKQHSRKTRKLVSEVLDVETTVVNSEFDALLLENNLIKELQPKYNILLKDDKSYPYLCITNERFPQIYPIRNIKDPSHQYFGPYPSVKTMHTLLGLVRKLYKIRTCNYLLSEENIAKGKFKVCLEYHIKNCLGPCEGLHDEPSYQAQIEQVVSIFKGNLAPIKKHFKEAMNKAAADLNFEEAQDLKKKLDLVENFQARSQVVNDNIEELEAYGIISSDQSAYINFTKIRDGRVVMSDTVEIKKKLEEEDSELLTLAILEFREKFNSASAKIIANVEPDTEIPNTQISIPKKGDLRKLIDLCLKNALYFRKEKESAALETFKEKRKNFTLLQLKADLNLKELPRHIECFDNSNLQGTNPVSAMVCFKDGKPSKKDYRHYNIKTVEGPDDFASMYEAVYRRYRRLLDEEQDLPHLVVVDGGKGQLSSGAQALKDLDIYTRVPIIGIAKRLEEIYFPEDTDPIHISKKSKSLQLIQRMRDEAHRFGITHHRQRRSNSSLNSELLEIEGIGQTTAGKLLKAFKSVKKIREASVTQLAEVIGQKKALDLHNYFKRKSIIEAK
jgi:excinuclease ABC subunit C